jgi:glycosyltransferase involved in cell wall biosynthesis
VRVLFVSNGFPPRGQWGTEYYTWELVRGLVEAGVEVEVLHPMRDGSRPRYTLETVEEGPVRVHLLHNAGDPGKTFESSYADERVDELFRGVLESARPDVVHFTYLLWGLSVRMPLVCEAVGVPSVLTLTDYSLLCHRGQMYDHHLRRCGGPHPPEVCARCIRTPGRYDAPLPERLGRRVAGSALAAVGGMGKVVVAGDLARREEQVRAALGSVARLIAPTSVLGDTFRASLDLPGDRVEELCYAIDVAPFERARPAPPREPVRIGFLGQFTPHKGLATLLRAVEIMSHRLPESVEPWELCLFGRGSGGRNRLFAPAVLGELRGTRVRVMEPFDPREAPDVLAGLHAVVLPSEWDENAPLTCLQARAAGVPIVGSDARGIAEVVEDGVHGRLFPMGDAEALADALRDVVLKRMGRTGRHELPISLEDHLERIRTIHASLA